MCSHQRQLVWIKLEIRKLIRKLFVLVLFSVLCHRRDKYVTLTFKYSLISNISQFQVFNNPLESCISWHRLCFCQCPVHPYLGVNLSKAIKLKSKPHTYWATWGHWHHHRDSTATLSMSTKVNKFLEYLGLQLLFHLSIIINIKWDQTQLA